MPPFVDDSVRILVLAFLKAGFIGFAIAAPVGPIGILCIKKTLELGFGGCLAVGVGAAFADCLYGILAAGGMSALSGFLLAHSGGIRILGGVLLIVLGYREWRAPISVTHEPYLTPHKNLIKLFLSVILLTLTNPLTIISYIGVFASIGSIGQGSLLDILAIVFGIFYGALTWWFMLGSLILCIRGHLPDSWLKKIRYISACIIGGFGVFAIYSGINLLL